MSKHILIDILEEGDKIGLQSAWFPGVADLCKSIPGARWDAARRVWKYPLSLDVCRSMREVFGSDLEIGNDLSIWAYEQVAAERSLNKLSTSVDASLELVPEIAPTLSLAMASRTYQRVGARFIAEAAQYGGVAVFDEPSLGKTITAYAGIIEAGLWKGTHLVAAPKTTLEAVWQTQLHQWAGDTGAVGFCMPEGKPARAKVLKEFLDCTAETKFLIVNPEMLQVKKAHWCVKCNQFAIPQKRNQYGHKPQDFPWEHYTQEHKTSLRIQKCEWPELFEINWQSVTFDEVQKYLIGIRGPNKMTQVGAGAMALNAELRIALTGTPFKGVLRNLWGILHWLRPTEYTGFWSWAETYLEVTDNGYGKEIGALRQGKEDMFYRSLDRIAIRRTKREVRAELPDNVWQEHWVTMTTKQKKQYTDLVTNAEADFGGRMVSTTGVLAELTRLKQLSYGVWIIQADDPNAPPVPTSDSPKLNLLLEMLDERGVTGDPKTEFGDMKFVVASQFTQIVNAVERGLAEKGIEVLKITGQVTGKRRNMAVSQFNKEGGPRVMLINTTAGGVGIDLDTWCDEMFILDETWVPDEQKQVEGRIDNRGERIATRFYHYIRTKDSVEEAIADLNIDKDQLQSMILDKRRGIDFARQLIGARK